MVSSNIIGARLLRDDGGRRDMERNIKRCISAGQERGCSSLEGTVVSSVGAGGDNVGCTGGEGAAGATGKGSLSLSR